MNNQRIHGFLDPQARRRLHAAFPQRPCHSQHSGEHANCLLLLRCQPPETLMLHFRHRAAMVAHHISQKFPLLVLPSDRRRHVPQKIPRGLLRRIGVKPSPDAMNLSRTPHDFTQLPLSKQRRRVYAAQPVIQPHRQSRNLCDPRGIPKQRPSRRANPGHRRRLESAPLRQPRSPLLPQVAVPVSQLPISLEAFLPFALNSFPPCRARLFRFRGGLQCDSLRQHIQIVHISEQVLKVLQIVAPRLITFRQEALDRIAESFHSNSQHVPVLTLTGTQRLSMQLFCCSVPLQCEALRRKSIQRYYPHAPRQGPLELPPGPVIELPGHLQSLLAQLRLFLLEPAEQPLPDAFLLRSKFFRPILQDLCVAQLSKLAEQPSPQLAHLRPRTVRINLFHHRGHRPAPPERHTQVMHRVRIRRGAHVVQLLQSAFHPIRQPAVLGARARYGAGSSHFPLTGPIPQHCAAAPVGLRLESNAFPPYRP